MNIYVFIHHTQRHTYVHKLSPTNLIKPTCNIHKICVLGCVCVRASVYVWWKGMLNKTQINSVEGHKGVLLQREFFKKHM